MKKLMIALLAAVVCNSLMASVLVYDYSASFKRIDVTTPVKVKYDKETYKLDSPKVVSDKFTGYMVIEACHQCSATEPYMTHSAELGATDPGNVAVVYITRKGSSKLKDSAFKNAVYRAIGRFYAVKFGAKAGLQDGEEVNPLKFTDAAGFLSYHINANGIPGSEPGFLGEDQVGTGVLVPNWWIDEADEDVFGKDYDTVVNAGFGKVKKVKVVQDCAKDSACWAVQSLSGSMLGGFTYTGHCSDFLFDVCNTRDVDEESNIWYLEPAQLAPISGTFTLKYNSKMDAKDFTSAEKAILKKMVTGKNGKNVDAYLYADPEETTAFESVYEDEDLEDADDWNPIPTGYAITIDED